ncbi:MAG: tRNA-(ms[2]io[6]A)-hydroxylase [Chitinophagales bacterium]|nr:tRNA-(ms[2]io[6]A)-hydroxylase [Chitinophagales bacterium]
MYGLKLPTDPRWVNLAEKSLEDILTDHAYCEQKAASTGISLIQQYPDREKLVEELTPVVSEEWGHFKMVMHHLKKRGLKLGKQRKDEYVGLLIKTTKKGGSRDDQLLEQLLLAALIEARSCERFRLLAQNIADEELQEFYKMLMKSEAGHYRLFLDLAMEYLPKDKVLDRWKEFLDAEADIIKAIGLRGDRIH